jgi:heme oxygenase
VISVLERIREETRPLHDAIERDSRLSRDDFDGAGYRWYLQKLLGFHAPLEERLKPLTARHGLAGEFAGRWKTPLFLRDLAALGLPATADGVAWSPWLPRPAGLGGLLGCAYVLEGATLGGKVLLRRWDARLPEMATARAYLDCYGDEVGPRWRALLRLLDQRLADAAEQDAAVGAARDCFQTLSRWLQS